MTDPVTYLSHVTLVTGQMVGVLVVGKWVLVLTLQVPVCMDTYIHVAGVCLVSFGRESLVRQAFSVGLFPLHHNLRGFFSLTGLVSRVLVLFGEIL